MTTKIYFFWAFLTILTSCSSKIFTIQKIECHMQKVIATATDSTSEDFLAPYRAKLNETMNEPLGQLDRDFTKKQPECLLGNWMSDAMQWYADSILKIRADLSSINYGGIRISKLPKGTVTLRNIYELMPFDNTLTVVILDSSATQSFFQILSKSNGWPISGKGYYQFDQQKNLEKWHIQKPQKDSFYIALTDYVATGGDRMDFLSKTPKVFTKVKIRDILIQYARHQKALNTKLEQRVIKQKSNEEED